jgi:hypothetical protein
VSGSTSASNETSPKTVTAPCSPGKKVLGGGYAVVAASGNPAEITVYVNQPTSDTIWTVTAAEDEDKDVGNWSLQAFVICATVT